MAGCLPNVRFAGCPTGNFPLMSTVRARPATKESTEFAGFAKGDACGVAPGDPPDPEATELANVAIVCAALALNIYIDTFV